MTETRLHIVFTIITRRDGKSSVTYFLYMVVVLNSDNRNWNQWTNSTTNKSERWDFNEKKEERVYHEKASFSNAHRVWIYHPSIRGEETLVL